MHFPSLIKVFGKNQELLETRIKDVLVPAEMTANSKVLLIDDDVSHRHDLSTILNFLGENLLASTSESWLATCEESSTSPIEISVALLANCESHSRAQIMEQLYEWDAGIPFVIVGEGVHEAELSSPLLTRVTAQLSGELNYQLLLDALHKAKLFHEHYNRLRDVGGIKDFNMFHSLVGKSRPIQKIRHMMGQVAAKEVSVLITGESGTGKEVVARNLHLNSSRAEQPFIPINCGAIPRELLESELFGHVKGAFTGAISDRAGRFELADGGTLFLDEIGDMPLSMQVKLLRVLQERSFERVGGVKTIQSDVRILAATHKDLEAMIEQGEFREDLYYRLNVFPIEMPPLRDRAEDVPLLLNELITLMEHEQRGSVRFNSAAIESLSRYRWPGNVRELANLVERMAILYPHGIVGVNDLPEKFRRVTKPVADIDSRAESEANRTEKLPEEASSKPVHGINRQLDSEPGTESISQLDEQIMPIESSSLLPLNGIDLKEYLNNLEKDLIEQALNDSEGVVARAADRLHIRRTTLVEKMRKFNLNKQQFDERDEKDAKGGIGDSGERGESGESDENVKSDEGRATESSSELEGDEGSGKTASA